MALRWIGAAVAAVALLVPAPAARAADDACWQMVDGALQRSAHLPHAKFISYGERITVTVDGAPIETIGSSIVYRDDGVAYIRDDRWVHPFVSRLLEPGPPVLGPYADTRAAWLSFGRVAETLPVIADVHAYPAESCTDRGTERVDEQPLEHLIIGNEQPERAGLRDLWIAPSLDIARVVVRAPLLFYVRDGMKEALADFQVDLEHVGGFTVVRRVSWQYRDREYSQWSDLAAEYDFRDYRFLDVPPPGTLPVEIAM